MTSCLLQVVLGTAPIFAQFFLVISPAYLLWKVGRVPGIAIDISTESLVLLMAIYAYRYRDIYANPLSSDHLGKLLHLFGFGLLVLTVNYYQRRATLCQPPTDALYVEEQVHVQHDRWHETKQQDEEQQVESLVTLGSAETAVQTSTPSERKRVCFDPRLFASLVIWPFVSTLYTGEHSLLSRVISVYYAEPLNPFWPDLAIQLDLLFTLLELNALVVLLVRFTHQRRVVLNVASPSAHIGAMGIDTQSLKPSLPVPTSLWIFTGGLQLSAALTLPTLVDNLVSSIAHQRPQAEREILIFHLVGYSMQLLIWFGFFVFNHFSMARIIQRR